MKDLSPAIQQLQAMLRISHGNEMAQATILQRSALARKSEFEITNKEGALDEAILNYEASLRLTRSTEDEWLDRTYRLMDAEREKYKKFNDVNSLRSAIGRLESTLDVLSEPNSMRVKTLMTLGVLYLEFHFASPDQQILDRSIAMFDDVLDIMPEHHEQRPIVLCKQGAAYKALSKLTGETAFLQVAARLLDHAVSLTPKHSPHWKPWLADAGEAWFQLYEATGEAESLEMTGMLVEEVFKNLPDDGHAIRFFSGLIAGVAFEKAIRTVTAEDLATATRRLTDLFPIIPVDDPKRPNIEKRLELLKGFERAKYGVPLSVEELMSEIGLGSELGMGTHTTSVHSKLGLVRIFADKNEEDAPSMTAWILELEKVLPAMPPEDPARLSALSQLSFTYGELFKKSKSMPHLDQAISYSRQGLGIESDKSLTRFLLSNLLVEFLCMRYLETRRDQDLDEAIEKTKGGQATDVVAWSKLKLHAVLLETRYLVAGRELDLDMYLEAYQAAWKSSAINSEDQVWALRRLGSSFLHRFDQRGAFSDIETAIDYLQQALVASPAQDPQRSMCLSDLGHFYQARYARTKDKRDLHQAAQSALEAMRESKDNTRERVAALLNLAGVYRSLYDDAEEDLGLDLAIGSLIKATHIAQSCHLEREQVQIPALLGEIYLKRYRKLGKFQDWKQAIIHLEEVQGSGDRVLLAQSAEQLGLGYLLMLLKTGKEEHRQKAISYLERVISSSGTDKPRMRLDCGMALFEIYAISKDWTQASRTASTLFSSLSDTMGRSLKTSDRQFLATKIAGLAADAAAVALLAGESAYSALRLLETGRGLVLSSILGLRSNIDEIRQYYPKLAEEYLKYRDQLDSIHRSVSSPAAAWLPHNQPDYRHNVAKQLNRVIETIRSMPGFEWFLQVPPERTMRVAAASRPIVVINASKYRCDAIIIQESGITCKKLLGVTMEQIEAETKILTTIDSLKSDILEWLWDEIAEPVLKKLDLKSPPNNGKWPKICWIPGGPLAKLPIHAAGYHSFANNETVLDRVISSYSVSVTALLLGRGHLNNESHVRIPETAVLIGMPELAYAPKEISEVAKICRTLTVRMPERRSKPVLESLKDCDIFHFAGHGWSNLADPSKSALILGKRDHLTVSDLLDINLHKRKPFLAFLSACGTGQIKQDQLMDEGIHLIAACQVAGFHHVIGTLFEVQDELCVQAARTTYEWIQQQGMSHESVAEGLHHAIRKLRTAWVESNERNREIRRRAEDAVVAQTEKRSMRDVCEVEEGPLLWVPYVHYGI